VPLAEESSVASVPVSQSTRHSFNPTHQRAAAHTSRSWPANQASLASGDIGCTGTPVVRCSSAACPE